MDVAGSGGDAADLALVDIIARQLMSAAEERVGSAADLEIAGRGDPAQLLALFQGQDQRLFGIDVFAGFQDHLGDRKMRIRDRQVDDDIDVRIGQQRLDRLCLDAKFGRADFGSRRVDVGAGDNLDALEERREREIGGGRYCRIR